MWVSRFFSRGIRFLVVYVKKIVNGQSGVEFNVKQKME
jgi:hypothetical protein